MAGSLECSPDSFHFIRKALAEVILDKVRRCKELTRTKDQLESLGNKRQPTSRIVDDGSNTVLVSAASVWEIATKVRLGKLPEAVDIERDLLEVIEGESGYTLISIDAETSLRAGRFASKHGDPFDRIISAQALAKDIPVISADPKLDSFGVRRIW